MGDPIRGQLKQLAEKVESMTSVSGPRMAKLLFTLIDTPAPEEQAGEAGKRETIPSLTQGEKHGNETQSH
jgi:hypothetical protein